MKKFLLLLSVLFVVSCSKDAVMYTLTTSANPVEGGILNPNGGTVSSGDQISVTQTPNQEFIFQNWSGAASGSSNTVTVIMDSDKTLTANYIKKKYALTTSVEGEGTVTEKVIKTGAATDYNSGTVVELTAEPKSEWVFKEWSGDLTGTENPKQITIDKAKSITAVFVKKQYALTTSVEGEGTIAEKVIKAGATTDYNSGTIVELTAEPSVNWIFKEWSGDLTGTENPKQITIDKPKTVKAIFTEFIPFYLGSNGVTIKAKDGVTAGTRGKLEGVTYTAVDNTTLKTMADNDEDVTKVVTTLITDMQQIFLNKGSFNQDISSWDVRNVTTMKDMFSGATAFNQDIISWDVSNVTNMDSMLQGTHNGGSAFNQDISSWDVSNVTTMKYMFRSAANFNQDISSWDVSNVTTMKYMFRFATAFNQDISSWDVSNVTNMSLMFDNTSFDQPIGNWDVSNVTDMEGIFTNTTFNQDIGNWDVSNVTDMTSMFSFNYFFNQDISTWDVSSVTNMEAMFQGGFNGGSAFNQDISSWDVSNVTDMRAMFSFAQFFNQDLSSWSVTNVTNCSDFWFMSAAMTLPKPNFTNCKP